ncbi:MAG: rod shape-determining protein RodA [Lachnospiraceae bacterium]|nr:rod shape-determining protein RodA [Lachnospiraceae bacterium]
MLRNYRIRDYNFKLVIYIVALTIIGIMAIGSAADESLQSKQIYGFLTALFLMVVISLFDYSLIIHLHWVIYGVNIALLGMVLLFGETINNAQRWLILFGIQFQPSETAKILLILFYAQFIMKCKDNFNSIQNLFLSVALFAVPFYMIFSQPDLSTSIVIACILCVMVYIGGLSWKIIAGIFAVIVPVGLIFLAIVTNPESELLRGYQQGRIVAFLNKEAYALEQGYQQENSVMAIGSGQLYGKGYKNNLLSSVKNANYIAEQETDFIFAVIGEEFGFIGASAVIILLMIIVMECLLIARRAKDIAGTVIATGVGSMIGIQGFINIGVATYILPNTGLPLPFVSYGLTSLVSAYIGIGFVLNVGLQRINKMT